METTRVNYLNFVHSDHNSNIEIQVQHIRQLIIILKGNGWCVFLALIKKFPKTIFETDCDAEKTPKFTSLKSLLKNNYLIFFEVYLGKYLTNFDWKNVLEFGLLQKKSMKTQKH